METKIIVWHNADCSKSNGACEWLEDNKLEVDLFEYLHEVIKPEDLKAILKKLGISAFDLMRKDEPNFEQTWQKEDKSEREWIDLMIQFPNLIQRPIVVKGNRAVIARPIENIEFLL
jgi:arsenate reductase (glutaredoxin)